MNTRTGTCTIITLLLAGAAPVLAQTPPATPKHRLTGSYYWQRLAAQDPKQDPKPEPKPEAKPTAATLAGKWTVSVESPQGPMEPALELKADPKDAKKVTGTIVSQLGEAVLEGEVVDGKLTFWITMTGGSGEVSITFVAALQKDGSLAGTLSVGGQSEMPWTAVRVKK